MKAKTLTYRQWQALQAVVDEPNLSHADRARGIGIAEHTFRSHLRHAYRAQGVHSLTGADRYQGMKKRFFTAADLINQLLEAHEQR